MKVKRNNRTERKVIKATENNNIVEIDLRRERKTKREGKGQNKTKGKEGKDQRENERTEQ